MTSFLKGKVGRSTVVEVDSRDRMCDGRACGGKSKRISRRRMDEGMCEGGLDGVERPAAHREVAEEDAADAFDARHVACAPPTDAEELEGVVAQYDLIFALTRELEDTNAAIFRAEEDVVRLQLAAEATSKDDDAALPTVDEEAMATSQTSKDDVARRPENCEREESCSSNQMEMERVMIHPEAVEAATNRREKMALRQRIMRLEGRWKKEAEALDAREDVRMKLVSVRDRLFQKASCAIGTASSLETCSSTPCDSEEAMTVVGPLQRVLDEMCVGLVAAHELLLRCTSWMQQEEIEPADEVRLEETWMEIRKQVVHHVNPLVQQLECSEPSIQGHVQQFNILKNTWFTYASKLANHSRQISEYLELVVQDEAAIESIQEQLGEKAVVLDKTTDQLHKLHKCAREIGRQNSVKMQVVDTLKRQLSVLHESHRKKQRAVNALEGGMGEILDGIEKCKCLLQGFEDNNKVMSGALKEEEEKLQVEMLRRKSLEGQIVDVEQSYHHIIHSIRQYEGQLQQMIVQQQQAIKEIKPLTSMLKDNEKKYTAYLGECDSLYKQENESFHKLCALKKFLQGRDTLLKQHRHLMLEQIQEETKIKFLTEELKIPMNVHHWRKLERNDPETYKLLQKSIGLQRQLVRKTSELAEQERQFEEKESRLSKLQTLLASQVTPDYEQEMNILLVQQEEKYKELRDLTEEVQYLRTRAEESVQKIRLFIDSMIKGSG